MPNSKLHIIWDFDGTLIDSAPEIKQVLNKSIKDTGFSDVEPIAPFRSGPPLDKVLKYMYDDKLSENNIKQIVSEFRKNYDNCGFNNTPGFVGIETILSDQSFIHHIITNKPDLATNRIIDKLRWKKYFASVVTPYSYMKSANDKRKTKSELFSLCMADYPSGKFVGIGDMETDVKAALDNNIPAIGVLWGTGTKQELEKCGCTFIVSSISELNQLLQTI